MAVYIIPLTPEPQRFSIALAGRELRLTVRWHDTTEGGWLLDIHQPETALPIVCGIPLVAGCDLLAPHASLGLGGGLWLDGDDPPSFDALGAGVELLFITEGEV